MRLIDADALYEKVDESQAHNNHQGISHLVHSAEHAHFKFMIHQAPTIDAEPVRYGRWETIDPSFANVYCSECGAAAEKHLAKRYKGCPFCLCVMDATDTNVGGKGGADNG